MLTLPVSAQSFMQGELSLNAGVGFGVFRYGGGNTYGFAPPISMNVEYSFIDLLGLGVYGGYLSGRYTASNDYSRFNALSYGARGTVHISHVLNELFNLGLREDKLDLYGSFLVGRENVRWGNRRPIGESDRKSWVFGPVGGARYFFTESLGVFAEIGRGVHGTFTVGASVRF